VNWVSVQAEREAGVAEARGSARLRGVEAPTLEEDVGRLGDAGFGQKQ